jgi:hypothetical protein
LITSFNDILVNAMSNDYSSTSDTNLANTNYEIRYAERTIDYQKKLNREVVEFESASRKLIGMPSIGDRADGSRDLINKLRTIMNRRYRDTLYEIFKSISEGVVSKSKTSLRTGVSKMEALFERKIRPVFSQIRDTSTVNLVQANESVLRHKRTIVETMRSKQHILFSKLIHNFVMKNFFVNSSYFFVRLSNEKGNSELISKVKNIDRLLRNMILKRVAPAFKNIQRYKKDTYSEDAIENLSQLMDYHISNRLSLCFSSVKSFVMEFQVLKVEEVQQDDYKSKFFEAMDKFKVLSDRSFDLNNLSGMALDDNPTSKNSAFAYHNLNVLEPVTAQKTSSRAITKRDK